MNAGMAPVDESTGVPIVTVYPPALLVALKVDVLVCPTYTTTSSGAVVKVGLLSPMTVNTADVI